MHNVKLNPITSASPSLRPEQGALVSDDAAGVVDRLETPVWIYDIDNSCILHANAAAISLWQADTLKDLCNRDLKTDMSVTVAKRLRQYQTDFIDRDATFNEMWTLYPKGEPTSVMVVYSGIRLGDGRMGMQCEAIGLTEDQPDNLRSAEALLHTDVMISLFSVAGRQIYMNPAARNTMASPSHGFQDMFVDPADYQMILHELDRSGEYRCVAKVVTSGGHRWYDLSSKSCSDAVTGEPAILLTAIDVSDLKIARDKARYLADRDQLTGCFNRAFLQQHMSMLAKRGPEHCALLYFDVDRFKHINDQFGHEFGDVVLKTIAARARDCIRRDDIVVRLGGDEFVVLLEGLSEGDTLQSKVDRLMEEFSRPIFSDATRISVGVSMGVVYFSPSEKEFAVVMREADIALYTSKQGGRNLATMFSAEMGEAAKERDLVELELKSAIEHRDFVLHFQPRVELTTGRTVSVEALVRWQHPRRGLIMPDKFIPVCEETGMIEELGQLVLELSCEQMIAWHKAGIDIDLSLNISPRQFQDEQLMDSLRLYSERDGFPKGRVELEITENVLIGDRDEIAQKLEDINAMGYRIAIDDFGTGYSNLSYISRFPLTCIKIDRSFINQLPKSGPVVHLILALARQIGATIVAEGVELESEFDWLVAHNCDQVQGYFLSPAVPLEDLFATIEALESGAYGQGAPPANPATSVVKGALGFVAWGAALGPGSPFI